MAGVRVQGDPLGVLENGSTPGDASQLAGVLFRDDVGWVVFAGVARREAPWA